jgi:hypothetical protein
MLTIDSFGADNNFSSSSIVSDGSTAIAIRNSSTLNGRRDVATHVRIRQNSSISGVDDLVMNSTRDWRYMPSMDLGNTASMSFISAFGRFICDSANCAHKNMPSARRTNAEANSVLTLLMVPEMKRSMS